MKALLLALLAAGPAAAPAEEAGPAPAAPPAAAAAQPGSEPDDTALDPVQPDFTVINLPTTLRLPRGAFAFRVTHRFARPLGQGDFGDLLSDFFGFDSGAQIGLELRFGLFPGTQLGINRTSDRTIQLFAVQSLLRQGPGPLGLAAYATFEGLDNLGEQQAPGLGLVLSRTFGERLALYALPAWVGDTNLEDFPGEDEGTLVLGLGGRLRLGRVYALVGEVVPRLAGYEHAGTQLTFGLERRVGGHGFQLNVSNSLGTTLVQVARGGGALRRLPSSGGDPWHIGFNISRKFY